MTTGPPRKRSVAASAAATTERQHLARPTQWSADRRADFVVSILGNRATAELLEVSPSQPSRWRRGEEVPGPGVAALLVDIDHVLGRLLLVWDREVAYDWLTGANPHLDGSRPIDVIATRGTADVVDAIVAEAAGAYS